MFFAGKGSRLAPPVTLHGVVFDILVGSHPNLRTNDGSRLASDPLSWQGGSILQLHGTIRDNTCYAGLRREPECHEARVHSAACLRASADSSCWSKGLSTTPSSCWTPTGSSPTG